MAPLGPPMFMSPPQPERERLETQAWGKSIRAGVWPRCPLPRSWSTPTSGPPSTLSPGSSPPASHAPTCPASPRRSLCPKPSLHSWVLKFKSRHRLLREATRDQLTRSRHTCPPRVTPSLHLCFTSGVCLPRETALFSVSAFPYPTVCIMPECLFASLHLCQIYFCLFLPWDPGGLGLRFLFPLCPGLEELVLSEMNSPSRTQTGDSSSVSSFSYREILREKESSTVPARVRGREVPIAPASSQILGPAHIYSCQVFLKLTNLDTDC